MAEYLPSSLPAITSVEIVNLQNFDADLVSDFMRLAEGISGVTVTGETAQRIASLWRQFPPGEQARCHIPSYGLRFRTNGSLICQASICWECCNIFGDLGGEALHASFDADARVSKGLLAEIGRAVGH